MSNQITVEQFASELHLSTARLLEQLAEAGVHKQTASDKLTSADKKQLLVYLKQSNGSNPTSTITLNRKKPAEKSTVAGVEVEMRRRRRVAIAPEELVEQTEQVKAETPVENIAIETEAEKQAKIAAEAEAEAKRREESAAAAAAEAARLKAAASKPEQKPKQDVEQAKVVKQEVKQEKIAAANKTQTAAGGNKAPEKQEQHKSKRNRNHKNVKKIDLAALVAEASKPIISPEEQAQRDEEARRAEAMRAHREMLLKQKQERQARREAAKQQAIEEAKAPSEQKAAVVRSATPT